MIISLPFCTFVLQQIIFDGFTVGRYDEGTDDNDFETTDTTTLMSASGTEACKCFFTLNYE